MNLGLEFQRNKVNRLIQINGQEFSFKRQKKNEYGEPIKDDFDEVKVKGFYHESSSFVSKTSSDSTTYRSKPNPLILCTIDDGNKLRKNDVLEYNGKRYVVVDLTNLNELNICYDVSLEVIQDG